MIHKRFIARRWFLKLDQQLSFLVDQNVFLPKVTTSKFSGKNIAPDCNWVIPSVLITDPYDGPNLPAELCCVS
jgi:hypothetical protein